VTFTWPARLGWRARPGPRRRHFVYRSVNPGSTMTAWGSWPAVGRRSLRCQNLVRNSLAFCRTCRTAGIVQRRSDLKSCFAEGAYAWPCSMTLRCPSPAIESALHWAQSQLAGVGKRPLLARPSQKTAPVAPAILRYHTSPLGWCGIEGFRFGPWQVNLDRRD